MAEILDIKDFTQVTNLSDDDRLLLTIAANNHFAGATTVSTLRQFVEDTIDYISTLGGLTNVNNEVDVQDAQDVFLVKSAGSDKWGKRNVKDFTGKDGVIAYPTMFLNPLTGRLTLQVPTNNYENRFAVRNGHLILIQS